MNYCDLRENLIEYIRPNPGDRIVDILAMLYTVYKDLSLEKGGAEPQKNPKKHPKKPNH